MGASHAVSSSIEQAGAASRTSGQARLILVFILDGLRPEAINPDDAPTLFRLRQEGANYINGHAVFPTVTRVNAAVDWAEGVLREFVLPDLHPDVVFNWLTEPDHMQHTFGAGSRESRQMLQNDDRHIGLILEKLRSLGLADWTDIFVASDHGFSCNTFAVNVRQELINAELKTAIDSDDVVVASCDQAVLLHVKGRSPGQIKQIVEFLQAQEWSGVIFTEGKVARAHRNGETLSQPKRDERPAR